MKKLPFLAICFSLSLGFFLTPIFAIEPDYTEYDSLLKDHLRPAQIKNIKLTGVDYAKWAKDARHQKVLAKIKAVDPEALNRQEAMAYWINAYNFLTIDLIIKNGETESIKNLGTLFTSPWKKHEWKLKNRVYTLDQIEHQILRPMGDARIHFAIVCASLSCPDLRNEAYTSRNLDEQLEDQTLAFLRNPQKGLKARKNEIEISKIFDWFEEDFGEQSDILNFVNNRLSTAYSDIDGYLNYDWSLNTANP